MLVLFQEIRDNDPHSWDFNGAILKTGVSKTSRKLVRQRSFESNNANVKCCVHCIVLSSIAWLSSTCNHVHCTQAECIVARQLLHWVELLQKACVTFLIDTHQSHVHEFGKQRQPKIVEILEDPWEMLTPTHSNTVVYFLRPDPIAMSRLQVEEKEIGKLTANFVEVLLSSYMRYVFGIFLVM